ncbi:C-type lectin domain family 4 member A [Prionailurus iriomotensis]
MHWFQNEKILREEPSTVTVNLTQTISLPAMPPAAPKEKTSLNKSNPSFPKLLFASLLVLLLLLAISFFIAFIIFFQKYSQLLKEKKTAKELPHTELECLKENVTMEGKDWSCCPKDWKPFSSNCYFISNTTRNWTESEKNCSAMKAHLLVVNTKDEQKKLSMDEEEGLYLTLLVPSSAVSNLQNCEKEISDFIIRNVDTSPAYYIGLSDPKGKRDWQWVDQTPYNESVTNFGTQVNPVILMSVVLYYIFVIN